MSSEFAKPTTSFDHDQVLDLICRGDRIFSTLKQIYTERYTSIFNKPPPKLEKPLKRQEEVYLQSHRKEALEPKSPISSFSLFDRRNNEFVSKTECISLKQSDSTVDEMSLSCFRMGNNYNNEITDVLTMDNTQIQNHLLLRKLQSNHQIQLEGRTKKIKLPRSENIRTNKYNISPYEISPRNKLGRDGETIFMDNEEENNFPIMSFTEGFYEKKSTLENTIQPKMSIPFYDYKMEDGYSAGNELCFNGAKNQSEKDGFECSFCGAKFFMKQQLGGHMSKRHAGLSEKYQKRLGRKKMREGIRKKRDYLMKFIVKEKNYVFSS
jgi:hypothetical protein